MSLSRKTLNLVAAVAALLLMSLLVWQTSSAAFTASTSEDITVDAGTITLTDNDASASFNPVLFPGDSDSVCVTVTYGQTPASPTAPLAAVKAYGSFTDGTPALSADVEVEVEEGCVGGSTILGSDTIATVFGTATDYASGQGTWVPTGDGDTQDYLVTFSMPSTVGDSAQGGSVDVTVTWEVQTS